MSAFLDAALSYAARGWPVLPLAGKIPTTTHGVKDATTDEATIRGWWTRAPTANVGIACGTVSGLLVVDVDARSGGLETIAGYDLPPTLTVKTGGGGLHLYYRRPDAPIVGGKGRFGPGVDCQSDGRYVVAPPSIHPETGQPYRWAGDGDIEAMPAKLIEIGTKPKHTLPALTSAVAARAPAGLDVVERARRYVSTMRESKSGEGGHDALFRVCCALVNGFDLDTTSARGIVDDYNATKAAPPWRDKDIAHKLADAEKAGTYGGKPRGCLLAQREEAPAVSVASIVLRDRERRALTASKAAPAHLLTPPGLVGDFVRWADDCSVHPAPLLSLAAGLATCSTILGRRYKTSTGACPPLFVVGVAESGVGKETGRQCSIALLRAAGLADRVGADDVSSGAAIATLMQNHPCRILLLDELGRLLEAYSSKSAASFERQIVTTAIRMWSSASGTFLGKSMAGKTPVPIERPHLSIYGTTTPGSLTRALKGSDVTDGVINRLVLIHVDHAQQREREPTAEAKTPPPALVERVKVVARGWDGVGGNLSQTEVGAVAACVPWSAAARDVLAGIGDYVRGALEARREHQELWVRAREQAARIALTLAVGCGEQEIGEEHLSWAWDLVRWSTERTAELVAQHVSEGPEDAARQAILRALGARPLTTHALTRAVQRIDRRTRDAALATLLDAGEVVRESVKTRTRSAQVYRLATTAEITASNEVEEEDSAA